MTPDTPAAGHPHDPGVGPSPLQITTAEPVRTRPREMLTQPGTGFDATHRTRTRGHHTREKVLRTAPISGAAAQCGSPGPPRRGPDHRLLVHRVPHGRGAGG